MATLEFHHPGGASEIEHIHARRLESLAGKTVAVVSDDMWQTHRMLPLLRQELTGRIEGIRFIPETDLPSGTYAMDQESMVDAVIESGAEAAIVGNAA